MPNVLTPLARHAGLQTLQVPQRFHGTEADDDSGALPWMRSGAALPQQQHSDEQLREMGVDAAGVRAAWQSTQYAAGYQDGERDGYRGGWQWGAVCGAAAVAALALVAGFVIASWDTTPAALVAPLPAATPQALPPAAAPAPADRWSARA